VALRFNPPPGWPVQPPGWFPPPGWSPDPAWPPPPLGWELWVEDTAGYPWVAPGARAPSPYQPATAFSAADKWAVGGAVAVLVGSVLPFVSSVSIIQWDIVPGARAVSAIFGIILIALALAAVPRARSTLFRVLLLVGGLLGVLGYGSFIVIGIVGFESSSGGTYAWETTVTFSPNVGLISCVGGCAICVFGAISGLRRRG
jgi:hypothetical protein